jgi:DNA helicase-2/ATP-dependent DNA helicase PcrA
VLPERIRALLEALQAASPILPQEGPPCFAHLRIETAGHVRDVLLGGANRSGNGAVLIHWQTAPLAESFFSASEGGDYEIEIDGRVASGRLLEKNLLAFTGGELSRVVTETEIFERAAAETGSDAAVTWIARPRPAPAALRPSSRRATEFELDADQQRIVNLPPRRHALILGEAGFGKTTVALHRLLALRRTADRGFNAAVIVPTEGLRQLVSRLIDRDGGVNNIECWQYERWAQMQARRAFRGLPRRESVNTSTATMSLKRNPLLRPLLLQIARAFKGPVRRSDLEHLFGDSAVLEQLGEALTKGALRDTLQHTHVQFSETTEREHAHVDAERLVTVDGRTIDSGTPLEDAGTIDAEDYALLFELDRFRHGERAVRPRRYDCLVLDEAQELAPAELSLVGRALEPKGTLIVSGDAAQQVDPASFFGGWEAALQELGVSGAERAVLQMNYRCPPEVTAFARALLEGAAAPPEAHALETAFHRAVWLIEEIDELQRKDPGASVALICRTPDAARGLARDLRHGLDCRLALDGQFLFGPGVNVTCVQEVKGLEFDVAILPDVSPLAYPDNAESRRALYVAATRATSQLVLATVGRFSTLLRAT